MSDSSPVTVDFRQLFESTPGLYLVLSVDPSYTVLAASDLYLKATMRDRDAIVGRSLFEVFPDNPNDATASGTGSIRESLDRAVRNKEPDDGHL